MKGSLLIYALGFASQLLFFARVVIQWFVSEKEGKIISPTIFWQLSLMGSLLFLTYGIFRNDFAIIVGQLIVYFVYVRNLQLKGAWKNSIFLFRAAVLLFPIIALSWIAFGDSHNWRNIFHNNDVSTFLMIWGIFGQVIFNCRFVYQWIYSEKRGESVLPVGFWIISIVGAIMIFSYGIVRMDPVLILGQGFSMFVYFRNLMLGFNRQSVLITSITKKIMSKFNK
ncbi:MAG: lipid-A-disaccharide synthase N-terminal domain-containing protein [Bacteroidota bacterium]|nr:lipid-A-disaccharide synthase N-terminal domain-containing protein [Bacteroidota bacterium]MDP4205718.1 lipid-A-disaccharide synthase N-terminal domain-containing protein [Bacteroidota bacterium]